MDLLKEMGIDPNSDEGKLLSEGFKEGTMGGIDAFLSSDKGKQIAEALPMLVEGLKRDMGNDEKMYVLRIDATTGNPVFYIINTSKMNFEVDEDAFLMIKEITNPIDMIKSFIANKGI